MKICLYAAGSKKIKEKYIKEAITLGHTIAKHEHTLIFGAGSNGIMATVADKVKEKSGEVIGITPEWMKDFEQPYQDCDEIIYTKNMQQRKEELLKRSDAIIVMPGGIGTLDEFFEVLTLKKLKKHDKAIVLYNCQNYYDTLIEMINFMTEEGVIQEEDNKLYKITNTADETLNYIENYWKNKK